jgi:hypothetical protein
MKNESEPESEPHSIAFLEPEPEPHKNDVAPQNSLKLTINCKEL